MRAHSVVGAVLLAVAAGALAAQDDLRDTVKLTNGRTLQGRVLSPWARDELLVLQGGKRQRVARTDVAGVDLVGDKVREFLDRRVRLRESERGQWILVEWAGSQGLPGLARLQAMHTALAHDDARAHEFLGHRRRGKTWQWQHEGKWFDAADVGGAFAKKPFWLTGERFSIRVEGELRPFLDALFDLERTGEFWYTEFGKALQLDETLEPVRVVARSDATQFQKWGFRPMPYFVPHPHGDEARTFFVGDPPTPRLLFFVGTQGLLYRSLIGSADLQNDRDRISPWLEIGLGMHAQRALGGDPGFAVRTTEHLRDIDALQALGRDFRLTHLLHLPMYGGFYLMDDTPTAVNWSAAAMFVQFLLDPANKPATRDPFLDYVRLALRERKGSSSSFDQTLGRRVEDIEAPFRTWLEKQAGF